MIFKSLKDFEVLWVSKLGLPPLVWYGYTTTHLTSIVSSFNWLMGLLGTYNLICVSLSFYMHWSGFPPSLTHYLSDVNQGMSGWGPWTVWLWDLEVVAAESLRNETSGTWVLTKKSLLLIFVGVLNWVKQSRQSRNRTDALENIFKNGFAEVFFKIYFLQ